MTHPIAAFSIRPVLLAAACGLLTPLAHAELDIKDPWIRGTVAAQKATGAFMVITATESARLVGVATDFAGVAEVHEMRMDGDVMRMRAVDGLDLPAGQAVTLQPGGYHLMLMQLKAPMNAGDSHPITLIWQDAAGTEQRTVIQAEVRALTAGMGKGHGNHKGMAGHAGHGKP